MKRRLWPILLAALGIFAFASLSRHHRRTHHGIPDPDRESHPGKGWRWNAW
jgi:hypothetical protein